MNFTSLKCFLAVIDTGSIRAAADSLSLARATVRRRIEELEAELGVDLLVREGGQAEPTPAGAVLAERSRGFLADAGAIADQVRSAAGIARGYVRVARSVGAADAVNAMALASLKAIATNVTIIEVPTVSPLAHVGRDVDVAITFEPLPEEHPFVVDEVGAMEVGLFATERYLAKSPPIRDLDDLHAHPIFVADWAGFQSGLPLRGSKQRFPVSTSIQSPDSAALTLLARWHQGIAYVPAMFPAIPGLLSNPPLVPVLPDKVGRTFTINLVTTREFAELGEVELHRLMVEQFGPSLLAGKSLAPQ